MDSSYIHADSTYDELEIYYYMFENTHALPIITINKRRGIVNGGLRVNRKTGSDLRREYASLNPLIREIEHNSSILEEIVKIEYIWYTMNRNYDTAIDLKTIAYNHR